MIKNARYASLMVRYIIILSENYFACDSIHFFLVELYSTSTLDGFFLPKILAYVFHSMIG